MKPNTIASSIAIGNPADGYYVIQAVRESGGWGESVTDEEILEGIKLLARTEGIFTEPAGGTEVAVAKKLIASGRIPRDESIVDQHHRERLQNLGSRGAQRRKALYDRCHAAKVRRTISAPWAQGIGASRGRLRPQKEFCAVRRSLVITLHGSSDGLSC